MLKACLALAEVRTTFPPFGSQRDNFMASRQLFYWGRPLTSVHSFRLLFFFWGSGIWGLLQCYFHRMSPLVKYNLNTKHVQLKMRDFEFHMPMQFAMQQIEIQYTNRCLFPRPRGESRFCALFFSKINVHSPQTIVALFNYGCRASVEGLQK